MWQGEDKKKRRGDEEDEEGGEAIGGNADPQYEALKSEIISKVEPKSQQAVAEIFSKGKTVELYRTLVEEGVPPRTIHDIMLRGINYLREGRISPGAYVTAVGEELSRYEGYEGVIEEMRHDGVLTERQYHEIVGSIKDRRKERARHTSSNLEHLAKAAVWIVVLAGALLMLFSGISVTGGAVGTVAYPTAAFIIGLVLFVLGLLLKRN